MSLDFFSGTGHSGGEFDGINLDDMLNDATDDSAEAVQEALKEAVYWGLSPKELAVYGGCVAAFVLGVVFFCHYMSTRPRFPRAEIEPWEPQEEARARALAIGTLSAESGARAYQSLGGGP